MTAQKIIDSLKFSAIEADEQKDLFTPEHTLFRCRFTTPAGKQFSFSYQCNTKYGEPTKKDCLYCLFSDASCFSCALDIDDFLKEFGYIDSLEAVRKGEKAYKACERTAKALDRLFTEDEKQELERFFEDY